MKPKIISQIPSFLKTSVILCGDIDCIRNGSTLPRGTFSFLKNMTAIKKQLTVMIGYIVDMLINPPLLFELI